MTDPRIEEEACLYVLDQLDPEERAAFEAKMRLFPEVAALAYEVEADLCRLAHAAPQIAPPQGTYERILARVTASPVRRAARLLRGAANLPGGWPVAALLALAFFATKPWNGGGGNGANGGGGGAGPGYTAVPGTLGGPGGEGGVGGGRGEARAGGSRFRAISPERLRDGGANTELVNRIIELEQLVQEHERNGRIARAFPGPGSGFVNIKVFDLLDPTRPPPGPGAGDGGEGSDAGGGLPSDEVKEAIEDTVEQDLREDAERGQGGPGSDPSFNAGTGPLRISPGLRPNEFIIEQGMIDLGLLRLPDDFTIVHQDFPEENWSSWPGMERIADGIYYDDTNGVLFTRGDDRSTYIGRRPPADYPIYDFAEAKTWTDEIIIDGGLIDTALLNLPAGTSLVYTNFPESSATSWPSLEQINPDVYYDSGGDIVFRRSADNPSTFIGTRNGSPAPAGAPGDGDAADSSGGEVAGGAAPAGGEVAGAGPVRGDGAAPGGHPQGVSIWDETSQEGVLIVSGLPPLGQGDAYQLWLVDPMHADPINVGALPPLDQGVTRLQYEQLDVPNLSPTQFFLTVEPSGGVNEPSERIVLRGP